MDPPPPRERMRAKNAYLLCQLAATSSTSSHQQLADSAQNEIKSLNRFLGRISAFKPIFFKYLVWSKSNEANGIINGGGGESPESE